MTFFILIIIIMDSLYCIEKVDDDLLVLSDSDPDYEYDADEVDDLIGAFLKFEDYYHDISLYEIYYNT